MAADIEEMFLQVRIPPSDQSAFCLLWWPDGNLDKTPDRYRLTVHPFGAVSSPFCAHFALQQVAEHYKTAKSIECVVDRFFYVDDCLASLKDSKTAIQFAKDISRTLQQGGFKLTKWVSNDPEVLKSISAELRNPALRELNFDKLHVERTLGMKWETTGDVFTYDTNVNTKRLTRRSILSTVSSIFDPLGLLSPFILPAKKILQRLCSYKLGWDDPLPKEEERLWHDWTSMIRHVREVRFPRCYKPDGFENPVDTQLHVFCDASETGYGTAIYIRYTNQGGETSCCLVTAKSRVTPMKKHTIPRLELTAAALGARLYSLVKGELKLENTRVTFWSDSAIVLHYIHNTESRYQTFIANRLTTIHGLTKAGTWRHVPSHLNIADWVSRGLGSIGPNINTWIHGPTFLSGTEDTWPQMNSGGVNKKELEVKSVCLTAAVVPIEGANKLLNYYSDWMKLLKAVVWYTRFQTYLRLKFTGNTDLTLRIGRVTTTELREAELRVVRFTQYVNFPFEMNLLANSIEAGCNKRRDHRLRRLHPILSEGLLRVGGRLHNVDISVTMPHPLILPNKGIVVDLIMRHIHESHGHIGATQLLAYTRQRYWVIQGGMAARRVTRKCITCKKITPRRGNQIMAPLPGARVEIGSYPSQSVGTDFLGHS